MEPSDKEQVKKKVTEVKTFSVPFPLKEIKENTTITTNNPFKPSKEQIINQAFKFHSEGNISEAVKYYQLFINQGFEDYRVFSNYGTILKDLGKLKEAELSARKAIELNPDFGKAYSNLGSILNDLGKSQEAELSTRKAIELNPNFTEAHSNLGNVLRDLGKLQEAELSTRKAIELNPNFTEAHFILGNVLRDLGKLQEAELSTRKAIELNPNFTEAHSNLGNILSDLGKLQEAESSTRKAIKLNPNFAEAHSNLGNILRDLGKLQEAELSTRKAIKLNPNFAEAYSNLGNVLRDHGNLQEAELSTRKAIKLNPNFAEAYSNLGNILSDLGKLKEAELSQIKAIEIKPNLSKAYYNLGTIQKYLGKLEEAEISQRKAIELKPDFAEAYSNLANLLLQRMKFKEGWDYYEWRWQVNEKDNYIGEKLVTSKPEWSLIDKGRVLLWGEQGIGDQILFTSLIPELVQKVDKLIIKVDKRLIPLLQRSFDRNIIYFDQNDFVSEDKYDFQIAMGSLPRLLRTNKESLAKNNKPYLKVDDKKSHNFRKQLRHSQFKKIIGISWKSMSRFNKDKSLSLEEFILGIYSPSFCFVNLQYGNTTDEIINLKKKYDINIIEIEEVDTFNDIDDLASLINACDQIVSIENLISDLAGSIGINSLILLNHKSHWRSGQNNDYSYWFPLQKLFRKNHSQTWDNALNQIQKDLINEKNNIQTSI
ncbi:tetratricopeptide repeat protein [Prochlorococcus marinus]|uniref:tetratricopeptide repeat protein n=1 Tax=Prochlorococcus marinus TaxID=1219 RepID=UPI0022B3B01B|nr:tetratricopeptide repeat protein [Prochlorococcus marinus]